MPAALPPAVLPRVSNDNNRLSGTDTRPRHARRRLIRNLQATIDGCGGHPASLPSSAASSAARQTSKTQIIHAPDMIRDGSVFEAGGPGQTAPAGALALWLAALAPRLDARQTAPLIWVCALPDLRENGLPFASGLIDWGLDPARLVLATPKRRGEALWAAEESLKAGAAVGVVLETPAMDLTASRRLSLASQAGQTPCLIARTSLETEQIAVPAAHGRYSLHPGVSQTTIRRYGTTGDGPVHPFVGRPNLDVTVDRHRRWREGRRFSLEWDHETHHFAQPALLADRTLAQDTAGPSETRTG